MNDEIIKGQFYEKELQLTKILQENILLKKYHKQIKIKFMLNGEGMIIHLTHGLTKIL